jgi:hypothetical protein
MRWSWPDDLRTSRFSEPLKPCLVRVRELGAPVIRQLAIRIPDQFLPGSEAGSILPPKPVLLTLERTGDYVSRTYSLSGLQPAVTVSAAARSS